MRYRCQQCMDFIPFRTRHIQCTQCLKVRVILDESILFVENLRKNTQIDTMFRNFMKSAGKGSVVTADHHLSVFKGHVNRLQIQ